MLMNSARITNASDLSSPGIPTLQRFFEAAILGFIFGPPELEEFAWDKVQNIIEFASKIKGLVDSDSDD
jgi:hypothetical protein